MSKLRELLEEFLTNFVCSCQSDRNYLPDVQSALEEYKAEIKREVITEILAALNKS